MGVDVAPDSAGVKGVGVLTGWVGDDSWQAESTRLVINTSANKILILDRITAYLFSDSAEITTGSSMVPVNSVPSGKTIFTSELSL